MTITLRNVAPAKMALAFAALLLGGCHENRTDLVSGTYNVDVGNKGGDAHEIKWKPDAALVLDMEAMKVTIKAGKDEQAFSVIDQGSQNTGDCAGEVDAQWATLEGGTPVIDGVTFHEPVIFTLCGDPHTEVYLGEGPKVPQVSSDTSPWLGFALSP